MVWSAEYRRDCQVYRINVDYYMDQVAAEIKEFMEWISKSI